MPLGQAVTLIRPLLEFHRAELLGYLRSLGQDYCTDATNTDTRHTRNRIRHELLPHLGQSYNPAVGEALLRLGKLAGEVQSVVDELVDDLVERCARPCGEGSIRIDCRAVADVRPVLVREMMIRLWREQGWPEQAMGHGKWEQLAEMATGDSPPGGGKRVFPGTVLACRQQDHLVLTRQSS